MVAPQTPSGATAAQIARARFGRPTTVKYFDFTVGTTTVKIAQNNPKRIQLVITNWGQAPISFSTNIAVTTTTGDPVQPNGGNAILSVNEDAEPVAWDYYAVSTGAGNAVHVEETEAV